jgi:hypothetical protein
VLLKHFLVSSHSEWEMHQTNVFLYGLHYRLVYKDTLISPNSLTGILNSVRMLYNTSLLIDVGVLSQFFSTIWLIWRMQKIWSITSKSTLIILNNFIYVWT